MGNASESVGSSASTAWAAWRHRKNPELTCLVPADVVVVRIGEQHPHLAQLGYSLLVPIKYLLVRFGESTIDVAAEELLAAYEPLPLSEEALA